MDDFQPTVVAIKENPKSVEPVATSAEASSQYAPFASSALPRGGQRAPAQKLKSMTSLNASFKSLSTSDLSSMAKAAFELQFDDIAAASSKTYAKVDSPIKSQRQLPPPI